MARELPGVTFLEAHFPLERLRARKTREELDLLRTASDLVVDSMLAVIASHGPGATKLELVEALRREEVNRGLTFEYCLLTAGTSLNRAPSDKVWGEGDILSLDSGGNYKGYIGDLCRMAIQGEPDGELEDLLGEVDAIQMAARKPIRAERQRRRYLHERRRSPEQVAARQFDRVRRPRDGPHQPRGAAAHGAWADQISSL